MDWVETNSKTSLTCKEKKAILHRAIFNNRRYACLYESFVKGHYYTVRADFNTNTVSILIGLIAKFNGKFCYKIMEESDLPSVYDCPLEYLEMTPACGRMSEEWREHVRMFWELRPEIQEA